MAMMEISVAPLGTADTSLSGYVKDVVAELEKCGKQEDIRYELTAMGTIMEGDLDVLLKIARKMHEVPFQKGARRVSTSIKIDDRRDKKGTINQKVESVKVKLREQ